MNDLDYNDLDCILFGPSCSNEEFDKKLDEYLVHLDNLRTEGERLRQKAIALLCNDYICLSDYLKNLLTILGQMDHIDGNNPCKHKHVDGKDYSVSYNEPGRMSMKTEDRQKLIDDGWKILEKSFLK